MTEDRTQVIIEDEIELEKPSEIWWFYHTEAQIELINNESACLQIGEKKLGVEINADVPMVMMTMRAEPLPTSPRCPGQAQPRDEFRKIAVMARNVVKVKLRATFAPWVKP